MAHRKNFLIVQGRLSNRMVCSIVSIVLLVSLDSKSYNKYAKYWNSGSLVFKSSWIKIVRLEYNSLAINSLTT